MHLDAAPSDQSDIDQLLARLDHPIPDLKAGDVIARAQRPYSRWRLAAGILFALTVSGAAYAAPGSPLPGWVRAVRERLAARAEPTATLPTTTPAEPQAGPGIAVTPRQAFVIVFRQTQAAGEARVTLAGQEDVTVQSTAADVVFTSEAARLVVDNAGSSASYDIRIPAAAPRIEIMIGATRVFLKENGRIEAGMSASPEGTYRIPLHGTGSVP